MVRCSPTEFTEYTELGSVGMAGMPYPPTSVRIRVICGRLFSARSFCAFRAFCGNIFSPTDFTDLHRCLGCALFPRNSRIHRICQRGYGRDAIPSYICEHPCRLWEALLCQRFCEFRAHLWEALLSQKFLCVPCVLWEYLFSHGIQESTEFVSVGIAGMPYPPNLCASVPSVGVLSLQEVLCIRCIPWELLHRLFGWCCRDCCTPWRNPRK